LAARPLTAACHPRGHSRAEYVPAGPGELVGHEDGDGAAALTPARNNDLWDCQPDGADDDLLSDGCVRIATLNDLTAEWTGGIFDATGTRFFVSVQHNVTGHGVVLEITGWK